MNKWKSVYSRVRIYLSGKGNRNEQVLVMKNASLKSRCSLEMEMMMKL